MKLKQVSIHNFRGIIDAKLSIHPYALLVGANNSGKSTIIDCIRAFYEKDGYKFNKETDFPFKDALDQESWIELTFKLTPEEHESIKEDYKLENMSFKVRKFFQTSEKLHDGKSAAGTILGYKSDNTLSKEPFYGAKNVQSGKFGELIYIPAISKVDEHTKLSGPSALRDLISGILSAVVEGNSAYENLTASVTAFADGVRNIQTDDMHSLGGFEDELNQLLAPWQSKFSLKFAPPSTAEIIKSMLGWSIRDDNYEKPQSMQYFGSGFQRHFIYSLIQLSAQYGSKKSPKKPKDFSPTLNLVLFEEPEVFLHPPQQEDLARSLIKMSDSDEWQVICSTHSANFVSRNAARIPATIRTHRVDGIVATNQISDDQWDAIVDSNQCIKSIADKFPKVAKTMESDDLQPEMEAIKYFLWLNPDRAGMLFAKQVLLVEGPTETAFLNMLRDEGELDCLQGTYVLDCQGKYNIHRFMNLLNALGVVHAVMHDEDGNKNEHEQLNQLIADSKKPNLTRSIVKLQGDLESVLGVPPAGSNHRKPQHLLYCYKSKRIAPENLVHFCTLIQKCFTD